MNPTDHNRNEKEISRPHPVDLQGDLLTVISDSGLPPGSRVRCAMELPSSPTPVVIQGKIVSIARTEDQLFRLVVRLHSLGRECKSALLSFFEKER